MGRKINNGDRAYSAGYWAIKIDGKCVLEHRYIASQVLGRPLVTEEIVHHIDRNRRNNDPSNLIVCSREYHYVLHRGVEPDPNKCIILIQFADKSE